MPFVVKGRGEIKRVRTSLLVPFFLLCCNVVDNFKANNFRNVSCLESMWNGEGGSLWINDGVD